MIGISLVMAVTLFISYNSVNEDQGGNNLEEKKQYQGPVPEGYDEDYFRETGLTVKKEEVNN